MEKTNEKRNLMKRIMLMLCAAVVAISTVLGSGVTETQAATLSGHGLSKKEKKEFTRILKKEAKKKEITGDNRSYATEWENGFQIKKGYAGYDSYSIQKINGKNVLCLYGNVVDAYYSCVTTCKMIYLVNGKVKTYTDEGHYLAVEGYSSKGLIMEVGGNMNCSYILTYKNGKIKASNYLYGDNFGEGNYAKGQERTKISKSEYDRIYNKYYADGKYKKIKDKRIKAFK